jgi:quaternary ammonium compound-resistance protein SugE
MAWVILLGAGLLEVVWLYFLKAANGMEHKGYGALGWVLATISFWMLGFALRDLPAGTAYAIWTGIGAVGGAALGIVVFHEPATALRISFIALVVVGIVGLKVTA